MTGKPVGIFINWYHKFKEIWPGNVYLILYLVTLSLYFFAGAIRTYRLKQTFGNVNVGLTVAAGTR